MEWQRFERAATLFQKDLFFGAARDTNRRSAIDERTTRHAGYRVSLCKW